MDKSQNVLIIGLVWPEPDSSAAGQRMLQLIQTLLKAGMKVTFASQASESDYMFDLAAIGVARMKIQVNDSDFDVLVKDLNPKIVIFDRFVMEEQFGWRVAQNCPDTVRILDSEDLHFLRFTRGNAVKKSRPFDERDLLTEDITKREIASILRCDLTLVISETEVDLLVRIFKIDVDLLFYLPLLVERVTENLNTGFDQRSDFVFIGNFLHDPNADAVDYLKSTIWPLIRLQMPWATLRVYGAYPSNKALQYHNGKKGFLVKGRAENAHEVIKSGRVLLAPLRFGAGLKGKLIESMTFGTPSITTTIGAEGIAGELPWNGFIADDPQEFADAAVRLYNDDILWCQMQQNGYEIVNTRFLLSNFKMELLLRLENLCSDLESHRRKNFLGAMLLHHTIASTKYMSKWIEAKNK